MARNGAPTLEAATATGLVLPGDRPSDVVAFEAQVVEFFVDAAGILGVPKSVAAIYGVVFASPTPLSFADVEARLDISKGSVSQGLRVLREIGAIKETDEGGQTADDGRRNRATSFVPNLELRKLVARFLENRVQQQLDGGRDRLALLALAVPDSSRAEAALLRGRIKSVSDWHGKARSLLPMARKILQLGI